MLSVFGLGFSFVFPMNWEKNIVAEALLPVVLAEAKTEKTPGKLKYQFVTIKH